MKKLITKIGGFFYTDKDSKDTLRLLYIIGGVSMIIDGLICTITLGFIRSEFYFRTLDKIIKLKEKSS